MPKRAKNSSGPSISSLDGQWDNLSPFERLSLILEHPAPFLEMGAVTRDDLERVLKCGVSEWEYIIGRQVHPLFSTLNLKTDISSQGNYRDKIKAALNAVFFDRILDAKF